MGMGIRVEFCTNWSYGGSVKNFVAEIAGFEDQFPALLAAFNLPDDSRGGGCRGEFCPSNHPKDMEALRAFCSAQGKPDDGGETVSQWMLRICEAANLLGCNVVFEE